MTLLRLDYLVHSHNRIITLSTETALIVRCYTLWLNEQESCPHSKKKKGGSNMLDCWSAGRAIVMRCLKGRRSLCLHSCSHSLFCVLLSASIHSLLDILWLQTVLFPSSFLLQQWFLLDSIFQATPTKIFNSIYGLTISTGCRCHSKSSTTVVRIFA